MRIVALYSHLNGEEYLLVHRKELWEEVQEVINDVDASKLKTKVSKERRTEGKVLYSPKAMNEAFRNEFRTKGWSEHRKPFGLLSMRIYYAEYILFLLKSRSN